MTLKSFSDEYIIQLLKTQYPKFSNIKNLCILPHNNIASINFQFSSNGQKYVFRHLIDSVNKNKTEKICEILFNCAKNNLKVSEPIKNIQNSFMIPKNKSYVTKFYDGELFDGNTLEIQDCAKNLALLHNELSHTKIPYNYYSNRKLYKHLTKFEIDNIKKLLFSKKFLDKNDKLLLKNLEFIKNIFDETNSKNQNIKQIDLPKQLIHFDLHPGNIVFKNHKLVCFLDFNLLRKDFRIIDIAFACFRFSSYGEKNIHKILSNMSLFLKSYDKINPLKPNELSHYFHFLSITLLSRLSRILHERYFFKDQTWSVDIKKYLDFLILLNRLKKSSDNLLLDKKTF